MISVQCHYCYSFYSRVLSMEVVANKEVLVAEKEVMVEARGFGKEWEETHVVKLR